MYCPHCDRRLTPDHRCLSRRVFLFGAMAGLIRPPKLYDMAAIEKAIPKLISDPTLLAPAIFRVPVTFGGPRFDPDHTGLAMRLGPMIACGIGESEAEANKDAQRVVGFYSRRYTVAIIGVPEKLRPTTE